MLINPSPTTPLATRVSGRAAGRAGQGRAGLGARCPRTSAQPSCCSTAGPAVAPAQARGGSGTAGHCQNPPWHSGCVPAAAWPGQAPGLLGSEPAPRGEPWGCRGAAVRSHRLCSAQSGAVGGLCLCSCTGFVSQSREPAALQMCQLLWRRRLVSTGGA